MRLDRDTKCEVSSKSPPRLRVLACRRGDGGIDLPQPTPGHRLKLLDFRPKCKGVEHQTESVPAFFASAQSRHMQPQSLRVGCKSETTISFTVGVKDKKKKKKSRRNNARRRTTHEELWQQDSEGTVTHGMLYLLHIAKTQRTSNAKASPKNYL